jgi:threonine/homoserine/homoserine lactone efflux protein
MEAAIAVASILGAITIGAMSPGPSFVLVARIAVARSRADGLAAAVGMGLGGVVLGGLALAGLQTLLAQAGWLYAGLKVVGGLYLLYLGVMIWRGAAEPIAVEPAVEPMAVPDVAGWGRTFALALATQVSNPKAIAVYGSIFAALLPPQVPVWVLFALPVGLFVIEAGWYAIVALAFSAERPRAAYLRSKLWIDRLAAAVMGALGFRLLTEAVRP